MEETYLKEEQVTLEDQLETWRPVVGYEGRYEVSDLGRVRSLRYNNTNMVVVLKQAITRDGYMKVSLFNSGRSLHTTAHQLVAKAFLGPYPDGMEVNHKDGNKQNNHVSNLEYVTRSRNTLHAYDMGLMQRGEKSGRAKLKNADVLEIREQIKSGISNYKIGAQYGVTGELINAIKMGRIWTHLK